MKSSMRKGNSHSFFLLFLTMVGILHQKQECNTAVRDLSTRKHQCLSSEGTMGDFSIGKHLASFKALTSVSRMPLAFASKNMSLARIPQIRCFACFYVGIAQRCWALSSSTFWRVWHFVPDIYTDLCIGIIALSRQSVTLLKQLPVFFLRGSQCTNASTQLLQGLFPGGAVLSAFNVLGSTLVRLILFTEHLKMLIKSSVLINHVNWEPCLTLKSLHLKQPTCTNRSLTALFNCIQNMLVFFWRPLQVGWRDLKQIKWHWFRFWLH